MDKLWALWVLDAAGWCFSEGVGLPLPLDLADAAVAAAPEVAANDFGYIPAVRAALERSGRGERLAGDVRELANLVAHGGDEAAEANGRELARMVLKLLALLPHDGRSESL